MSGGNDLDGDDDDSRRVHFFGTTDLASRWHAPRVVEIASRFDPSLPPTNIVDIVELHNVEQYLTAELIPSSLPEVERDDLVAMAPQIASAVARFFTAIDNSNFAQVVTDVGFDYHSDLLDLLGRYKAFDRCDGHAVFATLEAIGVHLGTMLGNARFVRAYDAEVTAELLDSPTNAEYIVRKYLEKESRRSIHLPPSLTAADARTLIEHYIDSDEANLNYVRLVANARDHPAIGIDPKLRLRAKRRSEDLNAKIFETNKGVGIGFGVRVVDDQDEPVVASVDRSDGRVWTSSYSRVWLESTLDGASVLNNFQHLFGFTDRHTILTLPSYPAELGVMERFIGLTGNDEYKTGAAFRAADTTSLLQTAMYRDFLQGHSVDLEGVLSWFCDTYLVSEFKIANFSFNPSAGDTSYLQRVRHLFAEMESLANQFTLFAENGELDRDLLAVGADQVRYKVVPSRLDGKYLYSSGSTEIEGILYLLFSDQSPLTYIDEDHKGRNATQMLVRKRPAYEAFHDHQKSALDHLIQHGILEDVGGRVRFANADQLGILKALFDTQAASYYWLSNAGRVEADRMVDKGWVVRESSLLTHAEADYFNYFLNRVDFSNGPNLRNKYLHGSQAGADDDKAHTEAYIIALRMSIALAIKINDDLCLWDDENSGPTA